MEVVPFSVPARSGPRTSSILQTDNIVDAHSECAARPFLLRGGDNDGPRRYAAPSRATPEGSAPWPEMPRSRTSPIIAIRSRRLRASRSNTTSVSPAHSVRKAGRFAVVPGRPRSSEICKKRACLSAAKRGDRAAERREADLSSREIHELDLRFNRTALRASFFRSPTPRGMTQFRFSASLS
jgi:hypothetical protein